MSSAGNPAKSPSMNRATDSFLVREYRWQCGLTKKRKEGIDSGNCKLCFDVEKETLLNPRTAMRTSTRSEGSWVPEHVWPNITPSTASSCGWHVKEIQLSTNPQGISLKKAVYQRIAAA